MVAAGDGDSDDNDNNDVGSQDIELEQLINNWPQFSPASGILSQAAYFFILLGKWTEPQNLRFFSNCPITES